MIRKSSKAVILTSALAVLAAGCDMGSPADQAERHIDRAEEQIDKGQIDAAVIELRNAVLAQPENGEARFRLGSLYLRQYRLPEAKKELTRAYDYGVEHARVLPPLLTAHLRSGEPRDVLMRLEQETDGSLASMPVILYAKSDALLMLGRIEEAYEVLQRLDGDNPQTLIRLAGIEALKGQSDAAYELAARAAASEDATADTLLSYAMMLLRKWDEKASEVTAVLDRAHKLDPISPQIRITQAETFMRLGDLDAAADILKTLEADKFQTAPMLHLQSVIALQKGDYEEARRLADIILGVNPQYAPSQIVTGIANAALGNDESAVRHLQRFAGDPMAPAAAIKALALSNLKLGRSDQAIAALQSPALDEGDRQRIGLLVSAAISKGEVEQAKMLLTESLKADPGDIGAATGLAALSLRTGDNERAEEILSALTDRLGSASLLQKVRLAFVHFRAGNADEVLRIGESIKEEAADSSAGYLVSALAYLRRNDPERALFELDEAVSRDPADKTAALMYAGLLNRSGKPDLAAQTLSDALKTHPTDKQLLGAYVRAQLAANKSDEAIKSLRSVIGKYPNNVSSYFLLARLYLVEGQSDLALEMAARARDLAANDPEVLLLLAQIQQAVGKYEDSVGTFRSLLAVRPGTVDGRYQMAFSLTSLGRNDEAAVILRELLDIRPDFVPARIVLARILLGADDLAGAKTHINSLLSRAPSVSDVQILAAQLADAEGRQQDALSHYKAAYALNKDEPTTIAYARSMWAADDRASAIALLEDYKGDGSESPAPVRHLLAQFHAEEGHVAAARSLYETLLAQYPDNPVILNDYAWFLAENGSPDTALPYAEKAMEKAPDVPEIIDTVAVIHSRLGQPEKAVPLLRRALTIAPRHAGIKLHLAQTLMSQGQRDEQIRRLLTEVAAENDRAASDEARLLLRQLDER